jgi:hypothetical protein
MSFSSYSTKAYCYQMMSILVTLNFHLWLPIAWGSHHRHHQRQLCRALPTLKPALLMTPTVLWECGKHIIFNLQFSKLSELIDPSCPQWESALCLDCWLLYVLVDSCLSWICSTEICDIVLCSLPRQNILHKFTRWTSEASICIWPWGQAWIIVNSSLTLHMWKKIYFIKNLHNPLRVLIPLGCTTVLLPCPQQSAG